MENFLKVINDLISEEKCSAKDLFPSLQIFLTAFEFFFIQELLPGTTNDANRLRQQLKEEEEEKERQKVATENKRRTKGQNKALAAFMKTTVSGFILWGGLTFSYDTNRHILNDWH